jgi:hypothetical protein
MNALERAATLLLLLVANLAPPASAAPGPSPDLQSVPYELTSDATFDWGCFGACACPVVGVQVKGGFRLLERAPDPLFENYDVSGVAWTIQLPEGPQTITGTGSYRVGGEFAVQQQMALDLSIGGAPAKHFDSGLLLGGGEFPRIAIAVSLHRMQTCLDTVIQVRAIPATAGIPPGGSRLAGPSPNPFRVLTRLELTLGAPGPVRARVFDSSGRIVRTLAGGASMPAGRQVLIWDGRGESGTECAPGRYFVHVLADGRTERRSVVKLE